MEFVGPANIALQAVISAYEDVQSNKERLRGLVTRCQMVVERLEIAVRERGAEWGARIRIENLERTFDHIAKVMEEVGQRNWWQMWRNSGKDQHAVEACHYLISDLITLFNLQELIDIGRVQQEDVGVLLQERENIANAGSALLRRQEKVLRELKTQNRILHQFVTRVENAAPHLRAPIPDVLLSSQLSRTIESDPSAHTLSIRPSSYTTSTVEPTFATSHPSQPLGPVSRIQTRTRRSGAFPPTFPSVPWLDSRSGITSELGFTDDNNSEAPRHRMELSNPSPKINLALPSKDRIASPPTRMVPEPVKPKISSPQPLLHKANLKLRPQLQRQHQPTTTSIPVLIQSRPLDPEDLHYIDIKLASHKTSRPAPTDGAKLLRKTRSNPSSRAETRQPSRSASLRAVAPTSRIKTENNQDNDPETPVTRPRSRSPSHCPSRPSSRRSSIREIWSDRTWSTSRSQILGVPRREPLPRPPPSAFHHQFLKAQVGDVGLGEHNPTPERGTTRPASAALGSLADGRVGASSRDGAGRKVVRSMLPRVVAAAGKRKIDSLASDKAVWGGDGDEELGSVVTLPNVKNTNTRSIVAKGYPAPKETLIPPSPAAQDANVDPSSTPRSADIATHGQRSAFVGSDGSSSSTATFRAHHADTSAQTMASFSNTGASTALIREQWQEQLEGLLDLGPKPTTEPRLQRSDSWARRVLSSTMRGKKEDKGKGKEKEKELLDVYLISDVPEAGFVVEHADWIGLTTPSSLETWLGTTASPGSTRPVVSQTFRVVHAPLNATTTIMRLSPATNPYTLLVDPLPGQSASTIRSPPPTIKRWASLKRTPRTQDNMLGVQNANKPGTGGHRRSSSYRVSSIGLHSFSPLNRLRQLPRPPTRRSMEASENATGTTGGGSWSGTWAGRGIKQSATTVQSTGAAPRLVPRHTSVAGVGVGNDRGGKNGSRVVLIRSTQVITVVSVIVWEEEAEGLITSKEIELVFEWSESVSVEFMKAAVLRVVETLDSTTGSSSSLHPPRAKAITSFKVDFTDLDAPSTTSSIPNTRSPLNRAHSQGSAQRPLHPSPLNRTSTLPAKTQAMELDDHFTLRDCVRLRNVMSVTTRTGPTTALQSRPTSTGWGSLLSRSKTTYTSGAFVDRRLTGTAATRKSADFARQRTAASGYTVDSYHGTTTVGVGAETVTELGVGMTAVERSETTWRNSSIAPFASPRPPLAPLPLFSVAQVRDVPAISNISSSGDRAGRGLHFFVEVVCA